MPFLSADHQTQVMQAVERAKQISMSELNAVIGQQRPDLPRLLQQMHQHPHGVPPGMPMAIPHPGLTPGSLNGQLALTGAPPGAGHPLAMLKGELHRPEESKSAGGMSASDERHHVSLNFLLLPLYTKTYSM